MSKFYCQGCREPAKATAITCHKCGGRIVKECPACGFILSGAKKYCDACGQAQTFDDKPEAAAPPPAPAKPPPKREEPKEPPKKREEPPLSGPVTERKESSRFQEPVELPPLPGSGGSIGAPKREEAPPKIEIRPPDLADKPKPRSGLEDYIPKTMVRRVDGAEAPSRPPEEKPKEPPKKAPEERPKEPPPERESPKERFMRDILEREKAEKHRMREAARVKERGRELIQVPVHRTVLTKISQSPRAMFSTVLGLLLLLLGAGFYAYYWTSRRAPERTLVTAAGTYLYSLKERNIGAAYAMLASQSRMTCSLDDFSRLQDPAVWSFDDIRIEEMERDFARVRYKLLVSALPVEEDWLDFVREDKQWRRAYTWHLVAPIDADLAAGDANKARARAETGININPRDPQMRAFLCEAAYLLMDTTTAERECRQTLEDVKRFPSRMDDTDIFRINSILADLYRNQVERYADAVRQYEILLAFPRLDERERCDIGIALADTRYLAGDHQKALADYEEASQFCTNIEDSAHIQRIRRVLSGKAAQDAVAAAKAHRMADPETGQETTLLQWRRKAREELAKKLHKAPPADYDSEESWTAEHAGGSAYKVSVRNLGTEVLTAQVDLWSRSIEVKINVQ